MTNVIDFPGPDGAKGKRGDFFAVDRRAWARACGLGMNAAVAYLVLARFSGPDQRTTKAGTNAVETYTGISRQRAKAAVAALEQNGLITAAEGITRKIVPAHEVRGCEGYPLPKFDDQEDELLVTLMCGETYVPPRGDREWKGWANPRTVAGYLVNKGWAREAGNNHFIPTPYDAKKAAEPDWTWLPNALVTGADNETPPVELVRGTQDVMTLRLLVDLYHAQSLTSDGGIHWRRIRQEFTRAKVGERGPFVVWGFVAGSSMTWPTTPFTAPHMIGRNSKGPDGKERDEGWPLFWDRWGTLTRLGLVEKVGHLIEADTGEAEIIHPYAIGNGEPIEQEAREQAHAAGRAMVTDGQYEWAKNHFGQAPWLAPVPAHMANVQMVGIARLKYRPRTALTAAWWAETQDRCKGHIERYTKLRAGIALGSTAAAGSC